MRIFPLEDHACKISFFRHSWRRRNNSSSLRLFRSSLIDTCLVSGFRCRILWLFTSLNFRSTIRSLAIICLGARVEIPAFLVTFKIKSVVSSPCTSGIPENPTSGLLPYCSSSSSWRWRSLLIVSSFVILEVQQDLSHFYLQVQISRLEYTI